MSLSQSFNCDGCIKSIQITSPRIHCLVCADYDLCADCALGEKFTGTHLVEHQTRVLKLSGGGHQPAVLGGITLAYTVPLVQASGQRTSYNPLAGQPPPIPPRQPNGAPTGRGTTSSLMANDNVIGWQPFFLPDMSPSPTYITLMDDIFTYLDPTNIGNLEPEVYSRFLDDMGYLPHENSWKQGLQSSHALAKEFMADKSLKNAFDLFSIDHILLQRIRGEHMDPTGLTQQYQRILGPAYQPSMTGNLGNAHSTVEGPMPCITRRGFLDLATVETLSDPSREWGNYIRLVKKYSLQRYVGWGDPPRSVLPALPDPTTMARIAAVTQHAREKGKRELAASKAYLDMVAQGEENALELLRDRRYVYTYRY